MNVFLYFIWHKIIYSLLENIVKVELFSSGYKNLLSKNTDL